MVWDKDSAREAGRKGGLAKAERQRAEAALSDEEKVRALLVKASPALAKFLLDVATGDIETDTKTRIDVAQVCLAYGLGKPGVRKDTPKVAEPGEEGLVLS